MADYSYEQMLAMQQEAEKRVREMRKKARQFAQESSSSSVTDHAEDTPSGQHENKGKMYVPHSIPMPNGLKGEKVNLNTDSKKHRQADAKKAKPQNEADDGTQKREPVCACKATARRQSENENDSDRALIMSLCFLLQAEKADEDLILALLYLLA